MNADRKIVLMLIKRKRSAAVSLKKLYDLKYKINKSTFQILENGLSHKYLEAHNAAELARRILYRGTTEI